MNGEQTTTAVARTGKVAPFLTRVLEQLARWPEPLVLALSALLILAIGVVDALTGPELAFSLFYILPIVAGGWIAGRRTAFIVGLLSGVVWTAADIMGGHVYTRPWIQYWNGAVLTTVFMIVAGAIAELRIVMEHERELSRKDSLTGLPNARTLSERIEQELPRARRYKRPLTLAYIDCDNFKQVNDIFGHAAGDELLRLIGRTLIETLRVTDCPARMGGDEFVVLLPETDQPAAQITIQKLMVRLREVVQLRGFPVSFSAGVVTRTVIPNTPEELIREADLLMIDVKRSGKAQVRFITS